jgi:sulfur-oxidizing protein SoxB
VFSRLLEADPEMAAYIAEARRPYEAKLNEKLAVTEGLLYRRGNFNGSFDELILQALQQTKARKSRSRPASAGARPCCRATPSRSST